MVLDTSTSFFNFLLSMQKVYISRAVPTAMTNGKVQVFNPDFVDTLDTDELIFLILHELMHPVSEHLDADRWGEHDQRILNIAGDHVINLFLISQGYKKMPQGGYADPKYRGWTTAQVYDELMKNPPPEQKGGIGQDLDLSGIPGMTKEELREQIISNTIQAVQQAEMNGAAGTVPAEIRRQVEELRNPQLPWELLLAQFVGDQAKDDFTRRRPNRRYWPDFHMPTQESEAIQGLFVAMDTSGSMSKQKLEQGAAEVIYIHNTVKPSYTRITTFDAEAHEDYTFEKETHVTLDDIKMSGGGGTSFEPTLELIKESQPEVIIVFSDGYFHVPDLSEVQGHILWVIDGSKKFKPSKGRVITM